MELDTRPLLAKFTAAKDTRIVADNGTKCMNFEAGETLRVHRDLWAAAIREGLVPEESLEAKDLDPPKVEPVTVESQFDKLKEACTTLILKGNRDDFTLVGQPRAGAVKKLVDFNFTARDVNRAFEEAMHEVEQDGDDSKEHSEPSSVAAE